MIAVAYYHCLSRVVNREFVFAELEREPFVRLRREYEAFYGVRILTYWGGRGMDDTGKE